jgi:hypothetical protein
VIEGDLIFAVCGGANESLLGIDKNKGKTVWKGESDAMTHATPTSERFMGQQQVIFFTQKGLVSVRAERAGKSFVAAPLQLQRFDRCFADIAGRHCLLLAVTVSRRRGEDYEGLATRGRQLRFGARLATSLQIIGAHRC